VPSAAPQSAQNAAAAPAPRDRRVDRTAAAT